MHAKDSIRNGIAMSDRIINGYIGDLDDAELLIRAVPGMNHIAWQIGHLLGTERHFIEMIKPGSCPPLPADFEDGHGRKKTDVDDPSKYYSRARYQELWKAQREATLAVLDSLSDSDLDRADDKFPAFAPTVGQIMELCGTHPLMHVGQFVPVRRLLNKPILM